MRKLLKIILLTLSLGLLAVCSFAQDGHAFFGIGSFMSDSQNSVGVHLMGRLGKSGPTCQDFTGFRFQVGTYLSDQNQVIARGLAELIIMPELGMSHVLFGPMIGVTYNTYDKFSLVYFGAETGVQVPPISFYFKPYFGWHPSSDLGMGGLDIGARYRIYR